MPHPATHIKIWLIPLTGTSINEGRAENTLSVEERDRADRLVSAELAHRFRRAHIAKRQILANCIGQKPEDLCFGQSTKGKPYLRECEDPPFFNLSHSADLAALAICQSSDVGIDIEHERPVERGLARRFFSPAEADAIDAAPVEHQRDTFLRCWTRKEAYLKATGMGLYQALDSFQVAVTKAPSMTRSQQAKNLLVAVDGQTDATTQWVLADFETPPRYFGAVAAHSPNRPLSITVNTIEDLPNN